MQPLPKEVKTRLVHTEHGRAVVLPDDFILEGSEVVLRQERSGLITMFPGSELGREVMWREFDLFRTEG